VTAQVTADVTAAMDPDGMGAHMGPRVAPLPLAEDGMQMELPSEVVTKHEFMLAMKELGGVFMQGQATTLEIGQKNQTQVFGLVETVSDKVMGCVQNLSTQVVTLNNEVVGHVVTLNTEVMGHVMTLNSEIMGHVQTLNTQMKSYVDQEVEAKGREFDTKCKEMEAKCKEMEAKFEQRLASVLSVQGKPLKKRAKKLSKKISENIFFCHGKYNWRKTIKKKLGYKGSYKTLGEAQKGLAQFCEKEMRG